MSNRVNIIPTKFVNLRNEEDIEYGFRWWDDDNSDFDHAPDWEIPKDDLEFFAFVLENHTKDVFTDLMEWCYSNKRSICIARTYYEWDQWSPIYVRHLNDEGLEIPDQDTT